jgi:hypothetical protein
VIRARSASHLVEIADELESALAALVGDVGAMLLARTDSDELRPSWARAFEVLRKARGEHVDGTTP